MTNVLADPQIRINNETFQVVPNSIKVIRGDGEATVNAQSAGNGNVTVVYSQNVETKIGKVTLSIWVTKENIVAAKTLKDNRISNYISVTDGEFVLTMKEAALINDPELNLSNEGQAELEFHGSPVE